MKTAASTHIGAEHSRNLAVGGGFVILVTIVSEYLIRRRAKRTDCLLGSNHARTPTSRDNNERDDHSQHCQKRQR